MLLLSALDVGVVTLQLPFCAAAGAFVCAIDSCCSFFLLVVLVGTDRRSGIVRSRTSCLPALLLFAVFAAAVPASCQTNSLTLSLVVQAAGYCRRILVFSETKKQ